MVDPDPEEIRSEHPIPRVFSPTYPTWDLVGGTSRPAGETVIEKKNRYRVANYRCSKTKATT